MGSVDQILVLLGDPDGEVRCAAALVLGRLRPVRPETLTGLREALATARTSDLSYLLDALAATGDPGVLGDVLPFMEKPGSLAEQAVQISRRFGRDALEAIRARHADRPGWISGAFVKAVAGVLEPEAVAMLLERLDDCTWDQARATTICVAENLDLYPPETRALLVKGLHARLADPGADPDAFGVTTCLRLLASCPGGAEPELVARFAAPDRSPTVRRHALQTLARLEADAATVRDLRPAILGNVHEGPFDAVVRPTLELLKHWEEIPLAPEETEELLASPHHEVVQYGLVLLAQTGGAELEERLLGFLAAPHPAVRAVAEGALARDASGRARLVEVMLSTRQRYLADEIAELLASPGFAHDEALLRRLLETYVEDGGAERPRARSALTFLFRLDRVGLNAALARRARERLAAGEPDEVVALLQPLVRWRFSDEENRFLLAIAHLRLAEDRLRRDDPDFRRCVDILGPLARTWGFDLDERIAAETSLAPPERVALAGALARRGVAERRLALRVLEGVDASDLAGDVAEDRLRLIDRLGDPD